MVFKSTFEWNIQRKLLYVTTRCKLVQNYKQDIRLLLLLLLIFFFWVFMAYGSKEVTNLVNILQPANSNMQSTGLMRLTLKTVHIALAWLKVMLWLTWQAFLLRSSLWQALMEDPSWRPPPSTSQRVTFSSRRNKSRLLLRRPLDISRLLRPTSWHTLISTAKPCVYIGVSHWQFRLRHFLFLFLSSQNLFFGFLIKKFVVVIICYLEKFKLKILEVNNV